MNLMFSNSTQTSKTEHLLDSANLQIWYKQNPEWWGNTDVDIAAVNVEIKMNLSDNGR